MPHLVILDIEVETAGHLEPVESLAQMLSYVCQHILVCVMESVAFGVVIRVGEFNVGSHP